MLVLQERLKDVVLMAEGFFRDLRMVHSTVPKVRNDASDEDLRSASWPLKARSF